MDLHCFDEFETFVLKMKRERSAVATLKRHSTAILQVAPPDHEVIKVPPSVLMLDPGNTYIGRYVVQCHPLARTGCLQPGAPWWAEERSMMKMIWPRSLAVCYQPCYDSLGKSTNNTIDEISLKMLDYSYDDRLKVKVCTRSEDQTGHALLPCEMLADWFPR